ncbi:MAG: S1C family serine protease [Clostridia bacterium]|nr:S1C family serine protease [Clostridia bacterium]
MKKRTVKRIIALAAVVFTLGFSAVFGGCSALGGRDGINGKDLNIYDIYEAAKVESGNLELTFAEFLKEYLSYTPSEIEQAASIKGAINRSLLSSVSVQSYFTENSKPVAYNGSGVIIDVDADKGDMTVVTNCHVVYSARSKRYASDDGYADSINIWLYGSESAYTEVYQDNAISANIIAASKTYDVAVLQVTGSELVKKSKARAAKWSDSEEVFLGETAYAIGNANSQGMSANVGYISKDLEVVKVDLGTTANSEMFDYNVMRTSAAINSGNSGGGLFNLNGEVIGLVNSKGKDDAVGFGYALTAASTKRVVQSMLDNYSAVRGEVHYVNRVRHGINVEVKDMYSTGLNQSGYAEICEKVTVSSVSLSAATGKLESGDWLKNIKIMRGTEQIENMDINREHNFHDAMLSVRAGDEVIFTVQRGDSEIVQNITFVESNFEKVV